MTHLGNRQGLEEVLLCPGEAEEGMCLLLSEIRAAASGEQKHLASDFLKKNMQTNKQTDTAPNKISLTCLGNLHQLKCNKCYRYAFCTFCILCIS